jgi:hypothetical protein
VFGRAFVRNNPDDTSQPPVLGNRSPDTLHVVSNIEERHSKYLRVIGADSRLEADSAQAAIVWFTSRVSYIGISLSANHRDALNLDK